MLSRVWLAAQAVWGHKWTSANGDLPIDDNGKLSIAGALWANGLKGLTERQVMGALDRLAKLGSDWPPNLPELRKAAFGIPAFAIVNAELLTTTSATRTPFARLVWSFIADPYVYRHLSARDAERTRREAYDQACEHLMTGGGYPPEPAGEIEHDRAPQPRGIPKTREERIANLQRLGIPVSPLVIEGASEEEIQRTHRQTGTQSALHELAEHYRHEDEELP